MNQNYRAIKIWDNKHQAYIKSGNKQEWAKPTHAKNAALNYWYNEYLNDKNNGYYYHIPFKGQKRFEIHEVEVSFTKVKVIA